MRFAALILITTAALCQVCGAESFLPLQIGNRWEYTSSEGDETKEVTGTIELWGEEVFVVEFLESVYNIGLDQYWTTNAEGDVLIWGWWRDDDQYGLLFDPPIPVADAPLYLDKAWSHICDVYTLPDTAYAGQNEMGYRVYWEGVLSVPAGDFYSYGIGQYLPIGGGLLGNHSVTGELVVEDRREEPTDWYSDGVGETQYWTSDVYQLVGFDQPVAVEQTTWGAVKTLYGPALE